MRAADTISQMIRAQHTPEDPSAYFLTSWLAYHKILSEFSRMPDESDRRNIVPNLPGEEPQNQTVSCSRVSLFRFNFCRL